MVRRKATVTQDGVQNVIQEGRQILFPVNLTMWAVQQITGQKVVAFSRLPDIYASVPRESTVAKIAVEQLVDGDGTQNYLFEELCVDVTGSAELADAAGRRECGSGESRVAMRRTANKSQGEKPGETTVDDGVFDYLFYQL